MLVFEREIRNPPTTLVNTYHPLILMVCSLILANATQDCNQKLSLYHTAQCSYDKFYILSFQWAVINGRRTKT